MDGEKHSGSGAFNRPSSNLCVFCPIAESYGVSAWTSSGIGAALREGSSRVLGGSGAVGETKPRVPGYAAKLWDSR